jgi:hypothetical protein
MTTEVWLLWRSNDEPFESYSDIIEIYSTKEIAQKHCDELNRKESDRVLQQWRERYNKRPTELPDKDLEPYWEYEIQAWDVSTV